MQKTLTFGCYGTLLDTSGLYQAISDLASAHDLPPEQAVMLFSGCEDRLMDQGLIQRFIEPGIAAVLYSLRWQENSKRREASEQSSRHIDQD